MVSLVCGIMIMNSSLEKLESLKGKYDELQQIYGSKELDSIYFGGCVNHPDIAFVFMNPTARIIASSKDWKGLKAPWIGTKNIWDLFYQVGLLNSVFYDQIKSMRSNDWTIEFADSLYDYITSCKYYITNLGKCTQEDARALPDSVYQSYLDLLYQELEIVQPKVIVLFGNQVSSIVLGKKICVSECRKKEFVKEIKGKKYKFYSVFYPIGNGRYNIDKSIEDIRFIMDITKNHSF